MSMRQLTLKAINIQDFRVHILVCIPVFWLLFQTLADHRRAYQAEHLTHAQDWDPDNLQISSENHAQRLSLQALFDLQNIPVNMAGEELLMTIPGIGPELAHRIVSQRILSGPYREADDLTEVAGIGPHRSQSIAPYLSFD